MRRVIGRIRVFFNYLSGLFSDILYRSSAGLSASFRKEPSFEDEGYDGVGIGREVDREKAAVLEEIAGLAMDDSRNPRDLCDDRELAGFSPDFSRNPRSLCDDDCSIMILDFSNYKREVSDDDIRRFLSGLSDNDRGGAIF